MSEPTYSADELRRYAVSGAGRHGAQGEPGDGLGLCLHETPAAPDLYSVLRSVVVAHRVPLDEVDALTRDLIEVAAPHLVVR